MKIALPLRPDQKSKFMRKRGNVIVALFVFICFFLAVTQILGLSPDYNDYSDFFDIARVAGFNTYEETRFESGFVFFSIFLTAAIPFNSIVYGIFTMVSIAFKGWAISKSCINGGIFWVIIIFYLVRYLSLHELTQLRVAFSMSICMAAAMLLWSGHFKKSILLFGGSLFFQMQAGAIFPVFALPCSKRWQVIFFAVVAFFFTNVFTRIFTTYLAEYVKIIDAYQSNGFYAVRPNPFAVQLLIDWAMLIIALMMWERLTMLMKRIILIELIGMAIFYGGLDFGVVAHRVREFYSVFWVFFVADGLRFANTKIICYGFVTGCVLFYGYIYFFSGTYF